VLGTHRGQDFVPVLDGKTALIVPPSDTESLLHALTRLHEDVALRERLGAAVGRFAEERMDYPRVAEAYLELLDGAVAAYA
jgi:glycosyltransferase involved in cell wall biosynthesis